MSVDTQQMLWLFFGVSGRVARAPYILAGLLLNLITLYLFYRIYLLPEGSEESALWGLIFIVVGVIGTWSFIALTIKRVHDFGKPGVFSLLLVVPVVSIIAFIVFCALPGDEGPNQYGALTNSPA